MSDILIKGIEKPKACFECRFDCIQRSEDGNEHFCFLTKSFIAKHSFSESMKNFVLGNCPLVEIPENCAVLNLKNLPVHSHYFDVFCYKKDIEDNIIYRNDKRKEDE